MTRLPATLSAEKTERIAVQDLDGVTRTIPEATKRATVLIFVTPDCPIANRYAPEIQRMAAAYTPKKVAFYLVYADPDVSAEAARKHRKAFGYRLPALRDPAHKLVKRVGATVTPEAAVLTPDGQRRYRGRIDDRYLDFGKQRAQPGRSDLRNALDALLQNRPVPEATTPAIGCPIPEARDEKDA